LSGFTPPLEVDKKASGDSQANGRFPRDRPTFTDEQSVQLHAQVGVALSDVDMNFIQRVTDA
jgi:hypothetical protein